MDLAVPPDVAQALHAALGGGSLLVALFDPADRLVWCNAAYRQTFVPGVALPVRFADVLRHGFHHGLGVKIDCGDIEAFLADILPRRRQAPYRTIEVDTVDGRWLWMTETLTSQGWMLSLASDITLLKRHEQALRQAQQQAEIEARTDALTGVSNRRHLFEFGAAALARCAAAGQVCSVALIDLDLFKCINDRHGHDVGDAVLRAFAAQAQALTRQRDLFGRMGGEEFLLVLPGAGLNEAREVMRRLRACLQPYDETAGLLLFYSFSAGVAQHRDGDTFHNLLRRADRALYRAKLLGRDRTEAEDCSDLNTVPSS